MKLRHTLAAAVTLAMLAAWQTAPPFTRPANTEDLEQQLDAQIERMTGPQLLLAAGATAEFDAESAIDFYRTASLKTDRADVSALARFNAAQLFYRQSRDPVATPEGERPPSPQERLPLLRKAAGAFRAVLDVDPSDAEAARDVERVRIEIAELEEELEQQQQDAEQMQQQADQLQQLADQQRRESEQTQQQSESQQQQTQDQQQVSEQTDQQQQQMQQNQPQSDQAQQAQERAQESVEQAQQAQQRAEQQLQEGNTQAAAESQREAAEALERAAEQLRAGSPQDNTEQGENQDGEQSEQEQQSQSENQDNQSDEGEPQQDQTVRYLLDREQRQRDARRQILQFRPQRAVPVERDW